MSCLQITVQRLGNNRNGGAFKSGGSDHLLLIQWEKNNLNDGDVDRRQKPQILLLQTKTRVVVFPRAQNTCDALVDVRKGFFLLQFELGMTVEQHSLPAKSEWTDYIL